MRHTCTQSHVYNQRTFDYLGKRLIGVPNAHALNVTSKTYSRDKQTHMALLESRLGIYLSREINTCILLNLENKFCSSIKTFGKILDIEIYIGVINNLMLDEVLPKFLKSYLVHVWQI